MKHLMLMFGLCLFASVATAQEPLRPIEVVYLEQLEAAPTTSIVAPLLGPDGRVMHHIETNALLIVDTPARVRRVRELLARLETKAAERSRRRGRRR